MKYLVSALLIVLIAGFLTACNKADNTPCAIGSLAPLVVEFELVDKMQRDLLDTKTPGHYDTTLIKKLNSGNIIIISPQYNLIHPGLTSMVLPFFAG